MERNTQRAEILLNLCKAHTDLNDEEIAKLQNISRRLEMISRLRRIDVFIDCPCKNPREAIVVAQATRDQSLYEFSTIGYIIREENEPAVFRSFRLGIKTEEVKALTMAATSDNLVIQSVLPIFHNHRTIGVLIYEKEYARSGSFQEAAQNSLPLVYRKDHPAGYAYLYNLDWFGACIHDGVLVIDERGIVRYRNEKARQVYEDYGYVSDVLDKEYWRISFHGKLSVIGENQPAFHETELTLKGRCHRFQEYRIEGDALFFMVIIQNRTAEKRIEGMEQTRAAAMREAHHRMKNGLQTVYSLLDMQKRRVTDAGAAETLQDAMNRITSMVAAQEAMLCGEDANNVSLKNILRSICGHFQSVTTYPGRNVALLVDCPDIAIEPETAETLVLVVNELLQNAYKHAFVDRGTGNIRVTVTQSPLYNTVTVRDDGAGFMPEDARNKSDLQGFGLKIVRMLVENKLNGRFEITSGKDGTCAAFDYKTQTGG